MPRMTSRCLIVVLIAVAAIANAEEVLDNAAIVRMVKAGLTVDVIDLKIQSTAGRYDTSTDGLIALKSAGVPDPLIRAILVTAKSAPARPAAAPAVVPTSAPVAAASAAAPVPAAPPAVAAVTSERPATMAPVAAVTAAPAPAAASAAAAPAAAAPAEEATSGKPLCVDVRYYTLGPEGWAWVPSNVCVDSTAFTIDGQRVPVGSIVAHCRERSLGFPFTTDPDEWWFSDGSETHKVRTTEATKLESAAGRLAPSIPHGSCSDRLIRKRMAAKK